MQIDFVKEPVEMFHDSVSLFREDCDVEENQDIEYFLKEWKFPIEFDGVYYDKYIPGYEGLYAVNSNGDVISLEKTIRFIRNGAPVTYHKATKKLKLYGKCYHLDKAGITVNMCLAFLMDYCGFKVKQVFPVEGNFPIMYRGKKWVCWIEGLENKAAIATDGSVLTFPVIEVRDSSEQCVVHYRYSDETLLDATTTPNAYKRYGKNLSRGQRVFTATMATLKFMK